MAEHSTPEERTELPTGRRMQQLRKDGSIHMSNEIVQVASLITAFSVLGILWPWFVHNLKLVMLKSFDLIAQPEPLTFDDLRAGFIRLLVLSLPPIIVLILTIATVSSLAVLLQTKFNLKERKIDWRIAMLNPISGLKRIFSIMGLVNTLKAIAKLAMILPIAYFALKSEAPKMAALMHLSIPEVMVFTGTEMMQLFWKIMYILIAMAIFDFVWGRFQWMKRNKMTKQEVKEEAKSVEGDETTRRKIIAKGLNRIAQRIAKAVPKADVVITNPTHYAVALKYDRNSMSAPIVVAKGKDFLALRIREIAREHKVPILERKALARALYASVEVDKSIPYELFRAVAEVMAYVFRLKNPNGLAQPQRSK